MLTFNNPTENLAMIFDQPEAKGQVWIQPGAYGLTIQVNGETVAMIDLFPPTRKPAQVPQVILFDGSHSDDPLAHLKIYPRKGCLLRLADDVRIREYEKEPGTRRHSRAAGTQRRVPLYGRE